MSLPAKSLHVCLKCVITCQNLSCTLLPGMRLPVKPTMLYKFVCSDTMTSTDKFVWSDTMASANFYKHVLL